MRIIRDPCNRCNKLVEVTNEEILLRICEDYPQFSYYFFICPNCQETSAKPANNILINLFDMWEVPFVYWTPPLELVEQYPDQGPIDMDVILDFMLELEGDNLEQMMLAMRDQYFPELPPLE